jgi:ABC-type phosphate transport system ATPase subunit
MKCPSLWGNDFDDRWSPSGCGKSTFLRILTRMHEMTRGASLAGEVLLGAIGCVSPAVRCRAASSSACASRDPARISDRCAFFLATADTPGHIVEEGVTRQVFDAPSDPRTADYVHGRFG